MLRQAVDKVRAAIEATGLYGSGESARIFWQLTPDAPAESGPYPFVVFDINRTNDTEDIDVTDRTIDEMVVTIQVYDEDEYGALDAADETDLELKTAGIVSNRETAFGDVDEYRLTVPGFMLGLYTIGMRYVLDLSEDG